MTLHRLPLRSLLARTSRSGLAVLALSNALPLLGPLRADPLPTGAQFVRGNGAVSDDGTTMTVRTQGRSVLSWQTFNIGAGKTVDFQNDKAVLNYVRLGGGSTRIDGILRATNSIILLNNQGISVGRTALISVPSILLSTASLRQDSFDKFMQGVDYGAGLNAPLISIQLSSTDGPIAIDGAITSTNGGGIGLIAPDLSIGPTARLRSLGTRNASTGTDGVNTTVNGVVPKGSLWLGTTALSPTSYTQPIPGMPGAPEPTLPTGFGFTQVGGKPSPQRIQLSLQATYDFERVVIGSSGALPGQFDSLFFSPNFRATDFYVYDGIQAIEEGHRQATSGGLRRTLRDTQKNQLISDQLESDILGLQLPPGASLLSAEDVTVDANGQLQSGTLLIDPPATVTRDFINQFGSGAVKISVKGGLGELEGSNGVQGAYNLTTGQVTWTGTVTTPGQPTTKTQFIAGSVINQGTSVPPNGLVGTPGTQATFVEREAVSGTQGHSWQPCHTGNAGCKGGSPAVMGQVTYWNGHFSTDDSGKQIFVPDKDSSAATHVVYVVGGRYYVTTRDGFNPSTTPKSPPPQLVTPSVTQTVTIPGVPKQETRTFTEAFPIRGKAQAPTGTAQSSWVQPTPPVSPGLIPTLPVTAAPPRLPYNIPQPTLAPPSPAPQQAPTPTMGVPSPTPRAPTLAPTPTMGVPSPTPGVPTLAPTPTMGVPSPTPRAPTLAPTPTMGVPSPTPGVPTLAPTPTMGVPSPTPGVPTLAPTPTMGVPSPTSALTDGQRVPERPRAVLKPAVVRDNPGLRAAETTSRRPGLTVTYEVPRTLIEANIKGGLAAQSRATLPDGRPLPAELDYDPSSQTFTIRDTSQLPLPLDIRLMMPTMSGGQGAFVLTIGRP